MNQIHNNLNEVLGMKTIEAEPEPTIVVCEDVKSKSDLENDYTFLRQTFRTVINKSVNDHNQLSEIAQATREPRAYEVASMMLKSIADTSKELMSLHKVMRDLAPDEDAANDDAAFRGSPNDLLKALNDKK